MWIDLFRLDVENCNLERNEKVISLTLKVVWPLLFLIENDGRVVKKDELHEAVWQEAGEKYSFEQVF